MTKRIWILINERFYCTSSYKEAVDFAALFQAKIESVSLCYKKEKHLNYCGRP